MLLLIQELQDLVNFNGGIMNFSKELVDDLANKLLFEMSPEENKMVLDEFEEIDANMQKIERIAHLSSIEPMTHPFPIDDVILRSDDLVEELSQEEVLQNAAKKNLTSVIVPKVVS